jgi:hypothetical protein
MHPIFDAVEVGVRLDPSLGIGSYFEANPIVEPKPRHIDSLNSERAHYTDPFQDLRAFHIYGTQMSS